MLVPALILALAIGEFRPVSAPQVFVLATFLVIRRRTVGGLSAGKRLLAEQAWRPVSARVVRAGRWWLGCRIEVTDGDSVGVLLVTGLTRAHAAVIARTGSVWVVGDVMGVAVVRVDGSHEPWQAKAPRWTRSPRLFAAGQDPTMMLARRIQRAMSLQWANLAWLPIFVALGVWAFPDRPWVVVAWVLLFAAVMIAAVAFRLHRHPMLHRLPELVEAGPWTPVQASLRPWQARTDDTAQASAVIRLADGRTMTADMRSASVDLLGTVWDTGTLWFAGEPEPGKTMAAGYPGYPLLAVAVIR
ncbi:hypothetical protein SAMN05192558_103189 [Actinokineospora alba]|uniref:Uncharacterized protein n=1 Tax=Actinokineospora alba TaxID=504798 RepID=A0A1H0JSN5_9PSEU|nr:hypothetical protein [Actinokineospora alba]TDP68189.1 hypothetical protein C8E96_3753 [Actinokineospora alba]SDH93896.1 hypothetical protein SAMN05421871_102860 [Actinokineospora alba]SDO46421.1 hypothetical protein SAMN05192558_103189 [Actinokineospora alba]